MVVKKVPVRNQSLNWFTNVIELLKVKDSIWWILGKRADEISEPSCEDEIRKRNL